MHSGQASVGIVSSVSMTMGQEEDVELVEGPSCVNKSVGVGMMWGCF